MRKHISVFMLVVRSCVYKLLLVMLAMAAAETAMLAMMQLGKHMAFFELIDSSRIYIIFATATVLCTCIQLLVCVPGKAQPRYTLARLSVSEKTVMIWHWLCGAICYLMLWAWQLILIYAFARWHEATADGHWISHQSIYLAAFRSTFIHSILPLEDVSRIARNIVMATCMGGICAAAAYKLRRGKKAGFGPAFVSSLFVGTFRTEFFEISYDGFLIFAFVFITVISMMGVFTGDPEVDYEEASLEN